MRRRTVVVLLLLAFPLVWLGGWYATRFLSRFINAEQAAAYGPIGDMFGASNAAFAGLGFLGLVVVLLFDLKDRKESRRPYLSPLIKPGASAITRAAWSQADHFEVTLEISVELKNVSPEVALNVVCAADLADSKGSASADFRGVHEQYVLPIDASASGAATLRFYATGKEARQFLHPLTAGDGEVRLNVATDYQSLSGTRWRSSVVYTLQPLDGGANARLTQVLDVHSKKTIGTDTFAVDKLQMRAQSVTGSWSQEVMPKGRAS